MPAREWRGAPRGPIGTVHIGDIRRSAAGTARPGGGNEVDSVFGIPAGFARRFVVMVQITHQPTAKRSAEVAAA